MWSRRVKVVSQGSVGMLKAPEEVEELLPELVARGAVQEEVDGVIRVHEKLCDRHDQFELRHPVYRQPPLLQRQLWWKEET